MKEHRLAVDSDGILSVESDNGEHTDAGDHGIEISKRKGTNYTESEIIRNLYSNRTDTGCIEASS